MVRAPPESTLRFAYFAFSDEPAAGPAASRVVLYNPFAMHRLDVDQEPDASVNAKWYRLERV
jgi:hypothetical protein